MRGFVPSPQTVMNRDMLCVAIGILGATVMSYNFYLHSSVVQMRAYGQSIDARRDAIRWATHR